MCLWYGAAVRGTPDPSSYQVSCPHCRKQFAAAPIGSGAGRGFKCPHCRLFVPLSRAEDEAAQHAERTGA